MAAFIIVLSLTPLQVIALNLSLDFKEESALTALTDKDWEILKATAMEALDNSPDGSTHIWKNEHSGNAGVMTIISTDHNSVTPCRDAEFFNTAGGISSSTTVKVCKQDDGSWSSKGPLTTTSKSDLTSTFGETNTSTEITRKTLGQTSDYCVQLFQDIERLKGQPIRRSAARDLHESECQR
jgi:surface antigen